MSKSREVEKVAILGIGGNVLLLVIKLIAGLSSGSQAMIADGLNSAGDVFSSVMTYVGNAIAARPDDHDHPYGHGKAEYVFSMIISLTLMLVGVSIFRSSITSWIQGESFLYSHWLVVVALSTIGLKALLYVYAKRVGLNYNSLLALANAEDHRNDIFVTSLTLLSLVTGYYGLYVIDAAMGVIIAIWIIYTGMGIFTSSYHVLMDTTLDKDVKSQMYRDIAGVAGIDHVDTLVSKPVGLNYLLIVKVSVDANLTIVEGHKIGDAVKDLLMRYELVDDVVVHLNPTQLHPQSDYLK